MNAATRIKCPIVYGCANDPMIQGMDCDDMLDYVFSLGINTFDTAEIYGHSEAVLGKWLKKQKREDIVILTKGCHPHKCDRVTPDDLCHDIMKSLGRLGTDYIDLYALHRDNLSIEVGPIVEVLHEFCEKGYIREIGVSNWSHERIAEANEYAGRHGLRPFTFSSPNYGLIEQVSDPWGGGAGALSISGRENEAARKWYQDNQMTVFSFSSLGRGFLSGKIKSDFSKEEVAGILDVYAMKGYYSEDNMKRLARVEQKAKEYNCSVSEIAIAWLLNQDAFPVYPIISTTRKENLQKLMGALKIKLSKEEVDWMYNISAGNSDT